MGPNMNNMSGPPGMNVAMEMAGRNMNMNENAGNSSMNMLNSMSNMINQGNNMNNMNPMNERTNMNNDRPIVHPEWMENTKSLGYNMNNRRDESDVLEVGDVFGKVPERANSLVMGDNFTFEHLTSEEEERKRSRLQRFKEDFTQPHKRLTEIGNRPRSASPVNEWPPPADIDRRSSSPSDRR